MFIFSVELVPVLGDYFLCLEDVSCAERLFPVLSVEAFLPPPTCRHKHLLLASVHKGSFQGTGKGPRNIFFA